MKVNVNSPTLRVRTGFQAGILFLAIYEAEEKETHSEGTCA